MPFARTFPRPTARPAGTHRGTPAALPQGARDALRATVIRVSRDPDADGMAGIVREKTAVCVAAIVLGQHQPANAAGPGEQANTRLGISPAALDTLARIRKPAAHIGPRTFDGTGRAPPEQLDLCGAPGIPKPP